MFSPFIFLLHSVKLQTLSKGVCCKLLAQSHYSSWGPRHCYRTGLLFPPLLLIPPCATWSVSWWWGDCYVAALTQKRANKSDLKQQTQCSDRSALSRTPSNTSAYSTTSTTNFPYSTRNKVDMQWLLNRHPEATREPCKKQELCFLVNVLLQKPRTVMGLGYLKTQ